MKKIFMIIGFLFLISCSSKEEQVSEKSQPQKEQSSRALNLRPIEDLGKSESQKDSVQKLERGKRSNEHGTTPEYEAALQKDIDRVLSSVRAMHE